MISITQGAVDVDGAHPTFVSSVFVGGLLSRPKVSAQLALFVVALCALPATASQTQVHAVEGATVLSGELEGASIRGDYSVVAGPDIKVINDSVAGAVLGVTRAADGQLYVATATPGKVYRINGAALDEVFSSDKGLITGLFAQGKSLVALSTPDGGADVIDPATKKVERVSSPAKLLLGGAVDGGTVYAVGSNDDGGLVLRLAPGKKAFEVVATTKLALRSIAVRGGRVVVGTAEEGIVYEVKGKIVTALLDADPGEVSAVGIGKDGTVFAAFIDGEGKLSQAASAKVRDDEEDDKKKKPAKARKVKGGEVWRITKGGEATMVFQSKAHGPYALVVDDARDRVLFGTGPEGRLMSVSASAVERPTVLTRRSGSDELTSLYPEKGGVVVGTAHSGSVFFVGNSQVTSSWLSPALEAEAQARYGLVRTRLERGSARVSLRTGHTKEPDESWGPWATMKPASSTGVSFDVPAAPYVQVKVELGAGAVVSAVHVAYLVDNRAPEVVRMDVLAPGWRVTPNPRNPPETRSVTFGEKPFSKFLDRQGAQNPTLDERPFGKQSFDVGYRTVYAYVEDADKDALQYRFFLGKQAGNAPPTSWQALGEWGEDPFVSFEASRLADGDYRVRVEVSDRPTNGHARALGDAAVSAPFVVSHVQPKATGASASKAAGVATVAFSVTAALPLISVRCSTDLGEWLPLDPADGLLDAASERFSTTLPATKATDAVSCEIYDEALNFTRFDIPIR